MGFKVVIPARYASTRLPAKPLLDIGGRPMIQWVIDAACASAAEEVLVATDDARIAAAAIHPRTGASIAVMTRADHVSGTDRIAEIAAARGWSGQTIVVNVQSDEAQLPPQLIDQVAELLEGDTGADLATLCTPVASLEEFLDPNVVKIVSGRGNVALYFSRAPIPWWRDGAPSGLQSQTQFSGAQRHLGIYAYRVDALQRMTALPPGELETAEKLEQLRALQAGMRILVAAAAAPPGIGIDTEHDLARVRQQVARSADGDA